MQVTGPSHIPRFSFSPGCGYLKRFAHNCYLDNIGVEYFSIEWANENCKHKWGWWFTSDKKAVMSFEDQNEMLVWALKWYGRHRR
jgi:hypothetical protein